MQCFSCWVCLPPAPVEGKGLVPELWAPGKAPHLPLVSPMAPLHPNPLQWPSRCCPRCRCSSSVRTLSRGRGPAVLQAGSSLGEPPPCQRRSLPAHCVERTAGAFPCQEHCPCLVCGSAAPQGRGVQSGCAAVTWGGPGPGTGLTQWRPQPEDAHDLGHHDPGATL